jgi:hypothetical protein
VAGTEQVIFPDGDGGIAYLLGKAGTSFIFARNDNGLPNGDHGEELWSLTYQLNNKTFLPVAIR